MSEKTRSIVVIISAIALACVVISFAIGCAVVVIKDGNTPLVTFISGKIADILVPLIIALTVIVTGKDISNAFVQVNNPNATNATIQANTDATAANTARLPIIIESPPPEVHP